MPSIYTSFKTITVQSFLSPGATIYFPAPGCKSFRVKMVAGGANGGGGGPTAGGGGAGAYLEFIVKNPAASYNLSVGAIETNTSFDVNICGAGNVGSNVGTYIGGLGGVVINSSLGEIVNSVNGGQGGTGDLSGGGSGGVSYYGGSPGGNGGASGLNAAPNSGSGGSGTGIAAEGGVVIEESYI
jgi:23S rRNA pseudouridine2605 synthase